MAAFSLYRFFRFTRSMCAPLTAVVGFSCLLTFIFILYQPTAGPGSKQRVGWQSWDIISTANVAENSAPGHDDAVSVPEGVDWWNYTSPGEEQVDAASLPLDVWAPLLPHDTGLSEITVERCMLPPTFADMCRPHTTAHDDNIKGKWVRVDQDLNRKSGMWYLSLFYRRTRRLDVPLIVELRLLQDGQVPTTMSDAWHKVSRSIRDGVPGAKPLFLWYRTGETQREATVKGPTEEYITELDILRGADRPWYGFDKLSPPLREEDASKKRDAEWLTYRRGVQPPPKAPPLHFSHDGKFRIMQIADLHFAVSRGVCRDTVLAPCADADNMTTTLLGRMLDAEKPDLVVFTGDQLNGQGTTWDTKSVLAKFSRAVEERKIPWAAVFGNHDDEDGAFKDQQVKLMQGLPYSLVQPGPKDVHGVGNYVLKVKSADPSMTHLLTLYFLDSGSYPTTFFPWGFMKSNEYDYIHQDQIDWFLQESASIHPIERPFSPDTAKDLGGLWERQQVTPDNRRLAKPNALMFFHIPLQEAYSPPDVDPFSGRRLDIGLHDTEPRGSAKKNDGFFEKGLLKAYESEHLSGGGVHEVKVVGNGHCHITENCRRVKGVWMCFGGGGSYSGYSKLGFDRRFRIYDISDYGETIRTYKRTEHDLILDNMVLAGAGAPAL
ncbi:hypothetical protein PLICRDRAFT_115182 [Plicaturopsis crispa FD-325 SS-3]|nr:hypothetical protein PLICRDRAFT_115182 [Plicaturopsis crispa FD-325 SS-3]